MKVRQDSSILVAATGISTLGSQITAIALPWALLQGTSAALVGVSSAITITATVLCGVPAGAVIARLGPWRALLLHELAGLAAVGLFAITANEQVALIPSVVIVSAVLGAIRPLLITGAAMATADITDSPGELTGLNGAVNSAQQLGLIVGQATGGVLVGAVGIPGAVSVDVVTFVIGSALFAWSAGRHRRHVIAPVVSRLHGVRILFVDVQVRRLVVTASVIGAVMQTFLVYLPAVVDQRELGAQSYGWTVAAAGIGALCGGLAVGRLARIAAPTTLIRCGLILTVSPLVLPPLTGFAAPSLVGAMGIVGLGAALINAPLRAELLLRIPHAARARTTAAALTVITAASPLGALAAATALGLGTAAEAWTITVVIAAVGLAACLLLVPRADRSHRTSQVGSSG